jgi:hypothetical protein
VPPGAPGSRGPTPSTRPGAPGALAPGCPGTAAAGSPARTSTAALMKKIEVEADMNGLDFYTVS